MQKSGTPHSDLIPLMSENKTKQSYMENPVQSLYMEIPVSIKGKPCNLIFNFQMIYRDIPVMPTGNSL